MKRQGPVDIVMALWERFNPSPWVTLECIGESLGCIIGFEMKHSKTGVSLLVRLDLYSLHSLADRWTRAYVLEQLGDAFNALTENKAEAGVGVIDVYREDYPE